MSKKIINTYSGNTEVSWIIKRTPISSHIYNSFKRKHNMPSCIIKNMHRIEWRILKYYHLANFVFRPYYLPYDINFKQFISLKGCTLYRNGLTEIDRY